MARKSLARTKGDLRPNPEGDGYLFGKWELLYANGEWNAHLPHSGDKPALYGAGPTWRAAIQAAQPED